MHELAGRAIDAVLGASKPDLLPAAAPVLSSWWGNHTNLNGNDASFKLAADINNSTLPLDQRAGDARLDSIAARWGLVGVYNFPSTTVTGDVIAAIPATPCRTYDYGAGDYIDTPALFAGKAFNRWRGQLVYCVEFVSTPFQRGSVMLVHGPNGTLGTEPSTYMNSQVVEIDSGRCVEFVVPWTARDTHLLIKANASLLTYALGNFYIVCVAPLTSNTASTPAVYINVTVALRDAEFAGYYPANLEKVYVYQQSSLTTEPATGFAYGERVESVNQLLRAYSCCGVAQYTAGAGFTDGGSYGVVWPCWPTKLPAAGVIRAGNRSHVAYLTTAFYCRRGGLRFKAVPPVSFAGGSPGLAQTALIASNLDTGGSVAYSYTAVPFASWSQTQLAAEFSGTDVRVLLDPRHNMLHEVTVPQGAPWLFWGAQAAMGSDRQAGAVPFLKMYGQVFNAVLDAAPEIPVWMAGADDFTVSGFMWSPRYHVDP